MLASWMRLEARLPERNIARFYEIGYGTDLFGELVVITRRGRIGSPVGRSCSERVTDIEEARRRVRSYLQRRASAPRRIGCAYVTVLSYGDVIGNGQPQKAAAPPATTGPARPG